MLHFHEAEEHAFESHFAKAEENHHCQLDDYFCQEGISHSCEHSHHISQSLTKCFWCQFHFVKSFTHKNTELVLAVLEGSCHFIFQPYSYPYKLVSLPTNKGPPQYA
ncbi:MAG: hypothetical protein K9J84_07300 [Bacteroidia bacterium]|nr:hypothetical protein [Bacteroidia bacterium]